MPTITDAVLSRLRGERFKVGSPEEDLMFASFCLANMHMSYSQRLQDLWVLYELGEKRDGYFIDFGAGNGRDSSNSYILHRKYGWKGILVEPNIDYTDNLTHHASDGVTVLTGVAIGSEDRIDVNFLVSSDPSISTLHYSVDADCHGRLRRNLPSETRKIEMRTLRSVLDGMKPCDVVLDYASIDTEGSEYDILWAFFLNDDHLAPSLLTVEHNYNEEARQKIFDLLTAWGYKRRFTHYSGHDDWFIRHDALKASR